MNDWRIILILALIAIYIGVDTIKDNNDRGSIHRIEQKLGTVALCTHGESSVTAYVGKDGKIHQSAPATTGCQP